MNAGDKRQHRAEAELWTVYMMFVKPVVGMKITGEPETAEPLFALLNNIMEVTLRVLNQCKGHFAAVHCG